MQLVGAMPGLSAALQMERPLNYMLLTHFALIFVLTMALGKLLFLLAKERVTSKESGGPRFAWMLFFGAVLVLTEFVFLFALMRSGDVSSAWADFDPTKYLSLLISLGLAMVGLLSAYFLAQNQKYLAFLKKRSQKMQGYFPAIDPIFRRANTFLSSYPQTSADIIVGKIASASDRVSVGTRFVEEQLLQRRVWGEGNSYLSSLSRYVRYFHRGSVRFYMFVAILFFVIWSGFLIFI
jgi:hypothetical protein